MTTSEKVAYLKGLAEGMGIETDTGNGKLFKVIIDILEDLALDQADTREALQELSDGVDELADDLTDLEEEVCSRAFLPLCEEEDEDEDDEEEDWDEEEPVFYSVECPNCSFKLTVDEDILDSGSFECPECGELIDLTDADVNVEEVEFDEEEDEDAPF